MSHERVIEKLRALAKNEPCLIRAPECCWDDTHTVLCHIRRGSVAGIGIKPHDVIALPGCDVCNDISDGNRRSAWGRSEIDAAILRGWAVWVNKLLENEILLVCL